jgi:hypothetical protein
MNPQVSEPQRSRRNRRVISGIISLLVLIALCVLYPRLCVFREYAYCPKCGAHLTVSCCQIPFTQATVHRSARIEDTSFSQALQALHFVEPHAHQWKFAYGRGPGCC